MIIADECVNRNLVISLRKAGYNVTYIAEIDSGIPDIEVLKASENLKGILITEDSDFGEWVFAHKITTVTIIFLRYNKEDFEVYANRHRREGNCVSNRYRRWRELQIYRTFPF